MTGREVAQRTGGIALLTWRALASLPARPLEIDQFFAQLEQLGVRSLGVASVATLFTGMVLALQTAYSLPELGVKYYIGSVVAKSLVRELGPVLTALIVGGRIGAGMTAEIGSMTVSEQIDAMRSMAVDPVKKLVAPKLAAVLVMVPALTVLGDALGIAGGLVVAVFQLQLPAAVYLNNITQTLLISDIVSGVGKSFFFAYIIAIIGCYNGLNTHGGADGVGRATTDTVVTVALAIMISDYFLTRIFLLVIG